MHNFKCLGPRGMKVTDLRLITVDEEWMRQVRLELLHRMGPVGPQGRRACCYAAAVMQLFVRSSVSSAQAKPPEARGVVRDSVTAAQTLPTLRVQDGVAGVYGVVGVMHSDRPLAGAMVRVGGANRSTESDSAGRFFVAIQRPGLYMVRISQPGYEEQLFPVDVPRDRPAEASRLLDSTDQLLRPSPNGSRQEFDQRVLWRNANSAAPFGSESRQRAGTLTNTLNGTGPFASTGFRIGRSTCAFVDGVPKPELSLDGISIDDVEAVEMYAMGDEGTGVLSRRWPAGVPCGGTSGQRGQVSVSKQSAQFAVVWLRHSK